MKKIAVAGTGYVGLSLAVLLSQHNEVTAVDIIEDFETKPRLKDGSGNAMLVAGSIYSACKYYEIFQNLAFKKCAIVTSFNPGVGSIRTEVVGGDEETETFEQYEIYQKNCS